MMLQKKSILLFVVLIYCSVFVAGYQRVGYETAYYCHAEWNAAQPCSNIVDRDMGTYGADGNGLPGTAAYICLNYTIPSDHVGKINVNWKNGATIGSANIIPTNSTFLRLRVGSNLGVGAAWEFNVANLSQTGTCIAASYTNLIQTTAQDEKAYEIFVYWNIIDSQISIPANNTYHNTTNLVFWLNSSFLSNAETCSLWTNNRSDIFQVGSNHVVGFNDFSGGVSYWDFEGDATDNIGSNDGTVIGATLTNSKYGQAYSFDGVNDYVGCGADSSLDNNVTTISVWFKPDNITAWGDLVSKWVNGYSISYINNDLIIFVDTTAHYMYTNNVLVVGKWVHIAVILDNHIAGTTQITSYINGIYKRTANKSTDITPSTADPVTIGLFGAYGAAEGTIDEVRIFNYSLTPTQIKKLYRTRAGFYLDNNQILQANTQFLGMPGIFNDSTNLAPGITPKTNITTFNGVTNYLTMPAMELSLADGVVLSWWSKLNANDSITTTDVVFGNDSTTNSYIHFWVNGSTNVLCMEGDVDGDTDCWTLLRAPSVSLSHYVITCEGYVCKAYQDAQELSLWLYDGVLSSNLTIKYLGKAGDSNYMFNGSISNILIFDDFWNQSTVQSYYDGSNSPASRGFVWNINSSIPLGTQAWQDYWLTCNDSLGTSYSENYSYYLDSVEIGVNTYFNPNLIHSVQNDKQTFTLELLNISWVVPTANLTYNGTVYESPSVSTTNNIDYNLSFNIDIGHDLNISVKNHTRKFWFNYSVPPFRNSTTVLEQNVYNMLIDNCSNYTTRAISFFLRNKTSEALMIGTIDGYFELSYHNSSETRNYNLSWDNGSGTYGLCMWPPFLLANITAQLEYVNGGTSHNYYFGNTQISNTSFDTDLYFVGGTAQVVFYVIDENDDEVVDAFIKVRMYDVSTNTHTTVEILKTDSDGVAVGNIILNTQQYSFVIEYLGQTVYTTNPTIITLSPKTFRISLGTDYFDTHEVVRGVSGSVVFDNDTKLFTFDFNDPSGRSVEACLEITKISPYGEIIINSSCVGSSSGTINLLVGGSSFVDSYLGTGTVQIEGITYLLDQASADFNYDYKTWGKEGLFGAFLLTTTLGMLGVGMLNPAVSIVLMVVAVVGAFLMKIINFGATGIFTIVLLGGIALYFVTRREN